MYQQMYKMQIRISFETILFASDKNYYTMSNFSSHLPLLADYVFCKWNTKKHFSLQNLIAQAENVNDFCVTGAHRIITVCNSLLLRSISPLLKNIMTGSGKISFFPVIHGTGCPIKQFTLYEKALIFRLFLA